MLQLWRGWSNPSILRVNDRVLIYMGIVDGCDLVRCINEMV